MRYFHCFLAGISLIALAGCYDGGHRYDHGNNRWHGHGRGSSGPYAGMGSGIRTPDGNYGK